MKKLRFWIGAALSLVGLWLALSNVKFDKLGQALAGANYWWLIPALALYMLSVVTRSERWRVLLGADRVDSVTAFFVLCIGYLISNTVPLRVGDPARAILIDRRCHVGVAKSLSTVVVERIFDVLAVVVMLIALIPFMQLPPQEIRLVRVFGLLGLAAVVGIVVILTQPKLIEQVLMAVLTRIPRISPERWLAQWRNLVSGFEALGSLKGVLVVSAWTVGVWVTGIGVFWTVMLAFFPAIGWVPPTFLLGVESLGMAVPATPGNWGVFEAIAKVGLVAPFGLDLNQSVSYAIALHFFEYLPLNLLGVMGLFRYSLSLGQISTEAEKAITQGEA